jgi:intein/homing endonuclease
MIEDGFYKAVEKKGYLKNILYGDSVTEDTNTVVKFKHKSHLEEISFKDLWDKLIECGLSSQLIQDKEYIFLNDEILTMTYNCPTDIVEVKTPKYLMRHKISDEIYKLNITNGTNLNITKNHSLLEYKPNINDMIPTNVKNTTYLPVPKAEYNLNENLNKLFVLLGVWFGDGSYDKKTHYPCFSLDNKNLFINYIKDEKEDIRIYHKTQYDFWINYKKFTNLLDQLKLSKVHSTDRKLPQKLFEYFQNNINDFISFLTGYWLADGTYTAGSFIICSSCKEILNQLRSLLICYGMYSHIKVDRDGRNFEGKIKGDMYVLCILGINPQLKKILCNFSDIKNNGACEIDKGLFYGYGTSPKCRSVCRKIEYAKLFNVKPVKILKKELINYDGYVYDFEISNTHNFIANGFFVHNTDSLFISVPIPNNKLLKDLTGEEILSIAKDAGKSINDAIQYYLINHYLKKANISPEYNRTYFKNEMILSSILFIPDAKKQYAYKLLAKEGVILKEPEINYTGIQIVRSNTAKFTANILKEMIEDVLLNSNINKKDILKYIENIADQGYKKFMDDVQQYKFDEVGIPCKWQKQDQFINGMKIYNYIKNETVFSLGSSGKFVYCKFNNPKLFDNSGIDMKKTNGVVFPYKYNLDEITSVMKEYRIVVDFQKHYETIFSTTCHKIVELAKKTK